MPYSLLLNTFVLPVQRIITIKLDEAKAVFRVPKDYALRMHVDNDELRELVQGLPIATAVQLDYITSKPLVKVPKFQAQVFILEMYAPEEGNTKVDSNEKINEMPETSRGGRSYEKEPEGELMYLESPVTLSDRDQVREVNPQKIYPGEEEDEWDSCASSSLSPELSEPALIAEMPIESPEPMSGYNSDSPMPSTLSLHSSLLLLHSCNDSNDSDDAYSPLSFDELTRGNMKSKYFAMEPIHLRKETKAALADLPNEPQYFVHRTSEANEHGDNTAFTYITSQHADEWHPAHKFTPIDNGPISPHPFSLVNNQYIYQVLETFSGPVNNSPLQHAELEKIHITIFHAHTECYRLKDMRDWGQYLIMQGVVDTPASTCIIAKDSSKGEIAPTPWVIVFLKLGEMMPGKEHIAEAVHNQENLETYKILEADPPFTFLNVAIMDIPDVYLNPWCPVLSHLHIIRIFIHWFLSLICKQFLSQQWCRAIDWLSPEDDAWHHFYWHNKLFCFLEPSFPTYLQGFNHQCMHIDSEAGGLHTVSPPRNPFLTAHVLFEQGFIEPISYYDVEERHHAFHSDELDLQYYDEMD
ncbi:hypothetical protein EV421DRAFT_1741364 [Armillaria borealis]|uniref:Uncharacterized protein n=1 Tax=Armillaria borealis TaxID=47425 RepID=A0AA39J1N7_9AGAR|nr:hypothetical protein EV421DRAFT_1741364 [Armillaria borealis]